MLSNTGCQYDFPKAPSPSNSDDSGCGFSPQSQYSDNEDVLRVTNVQNNYQMLENNMLVHHHPVSPSYSDTSVESYSVIVNAPQSHQTLNNLNTFNSQQSYQTLERSNAVMQHNVQSLRNGTSMMRYQQPISPISDTSSEGLPVNTEKCFVPKKGNAKPRQTSTASKRTTKGVSKSRPKGNHPRARTVREQLEQLAKMKKIRESIAQSQQTRPQQAATQAARLSQQNDTPHAPDTMIPQQQQPVCNMVQQQQIPQQQQTPQQQQIPQQQQPVRQQKPIIQQQQPFKMTHYSQPRPTTNVTSGVEEIPSDLKSIAYNDLLPRSPEMENIFGAYSVDESEEVQNKDFKLSPVFLHLRDATINNNMKKFYDCIRTFTPAQIQVALDEYGHDGVSLMLHAVRLGNLAVVRTYLDIDPKHIRETRVYDSYNLLHLAAYYSHPEIMTELLAFIKRDFQLNDLLDERADKMTPLHVACQSSQPLMVKLLLDAGASLYTEEQYAVTALHLAVTYGNYDIVRLICERLQNDATKFTVLNKKTVDGDTALHFAARLAAGNKDQLRIVQLLLMCDANPHISNCHGYLPQHESSTQEVMDIFVRYTSSCMDASSVHHQMTCTTLPTTSCMMNDASSYTTYNVAPASTFHDFEIPTTSSDEDDFSIIFQ